MMKAKILLISVLTVAVSGCTTVGPYSSGSGRTDAPVYDPYYPSGQSGGKYRPQQEISPKISRLPPQESVDVKPDSHSEPSQSMSPAVVALISQAETSSRAGDLDAAVAITERALRIQPRNAELVYKLAALRLKQGKPRLAEDLAKKANLLSSGNASLKRRSWLLIAESRRMQGRIQEAREAERNAAQY